MSAGQVLATIAVLLAVAALVGVGYPVLPVAVILVALLKFVP
jgi:hypothetical protein